MPGSGRSPGGSHGNPLQYSCLENPMYRGAWWATAHTVAKSWTQLSDLAPMPAHQYVRYRASNKLSRILNLLNRTI